MQVLAPNDTEVGSTPFRIRFVGYSTNHRELNASTVNTVANLNFMRAPRVQLSEKGEGMFRLSASLLYVGELKSGEPDGKGTVYDLATRLAVYEGSFSNGVYSGRGKRYSRGELIEEGDFANGLLTSGIRHLPNGLLQCGSFVNDELCEPAVFGGNSVGEERHEICHRRGAAEGNELLLRGRRVHFGPREPRVFVLL